VTPLPVPTFQVERVAAGEALSTLGKHLCHGLRLHAQRFGISVPAAPFDPNAEVSPALALDIVNRLAGRLFPRLARDAAGPAGPVGPVGAAAEAVEAAAEASIDGVDPSPDTP
jgi:hypothetical protein